MDPKRCVDSSTSLYLNRLRQQHYLQHTTSVMGVEVFSVGVRGVKGPFTTPLGVRGVKGPLSYRLILLLLFIFILINCDTVTSSTRSHHAHLSRDRSSGTVMNDEQFHKTSMTTGDDATCQLDADGRHVGMDECIEQGHEFLNKYAKARAKKEIGDGTETGNSKCGLYRKFHSNFMKWYNRCESLRNHSEYRLWLGVIQYMDCVCNHTADCLSGQTCFFRQLVSFWGERCNDFYKFNIDQNTRDPCHFLEENTQCKLSLIRSACNDVTMSFATSVIRISAGVEAKVRNCSLANHVQDTFPGQFGYTDGCRTRFAEEIDVCIKPLTRKKVLEFNKELNLIPAEKVKNRMLSKACRAWASYHQCMAPLNESCPQGVQLVMDSQHDIRQYFLKMDIICVPDNLPEFTSSLACYKKVMRKKVLSQCSGFWTNISRAQKNITAYQLYCQPHHPHTVKLSSELERVRNCHIEVFSKTCGANASRPIAALFQKAFQDPKYLRLGFKPDCELHAPLTTTTIATTTTTTMTTATTTLPETEIVLYRTLTPESGVDDGGGYKIARSGHNVKTGDAIAHSVVSTCSFARWRYNIEMLLFVTTLDLFLLLRRS